MTQFYPAERDTTSKTWVKLFNQRLSKDSDLRNNSLLDASKRTASGSFVYLVLWLAISFCGGLQREHLGLVTVNAALFLAAGTVRLLYSRALPSLIKTQARLAWVGFMGVLLWCPAQWGLLGALTIFDPSLNGYAMPIELAAAGIAAAGTFSTAIIPAMRFLLPIVVTIPYVLAAAIWPTQDRTLIALLIIIFVIYLLFASRVVYADYWTAQTYRLRLERRAKQLEVLSTTDALTTLRNRMFFDTHFNIEWNRACRRQEPVAILLLDLDHFKRINDDYGHGFGDACLRSLAPALGEGILRGSDILARYGGEEFIIMLSDTSLDDAMRVAERVLAAVRNIVILHGGARVNVTCSIGMAVRIPSVQDQGYRLIKEADEALYAAKLSGRDKLVVYNCD